MDHSVSSERISKALPFQRINHFPGMMEICRKVSLSNLIKRMQVVCPDLYTFHPDNWTIPDELDVFIAALREREKLRNHHDDGNISTFIIKPNAGSMGRNISLVQRASQLPPRRSLLDLHAVAQEVRENKKREL